MGHVLYSQKSKATGHHFLNLQEVSRVTLWTASHGIKVITSEMQVCFVLFFSHKLLIWNCETLYGAGWGVGPVLSPSVTVLEFQQGLKIEFAWNQVRDGESHNSRVLLECFVVKLHGFPKRRAAGWWGWRWGTCLLRFAAAHTCWVSSISEICPCSCHGLPD